VDTHYIIKIRTK